MSAQTASVIPSVEIDLPLFCEERCAVGSAVGGNDGPADTIGIDVFEPADSYILELELKLCVDVILEGS